MKKKLTALSGILIAAFFIVSVANGQSTSREVKKAATEKSACCAKGMLSAGCGMMTATKNAGSKKCEPVKYKEMGCDPARCKAGKCDPATSKTVCKCAGGQMKKCDPGK